MVRPGSERLVGPPLCRKCGETDSSKLTRHYRMPWGYALICRVCKLAENRKRDQYSWNVINYLKALGCQTCNEDTPECLQFHHVKQKQYNVTANIGCTYRRLIKELSKCVVLCANCHCKIHAGILDTSNIILLSEEELMIMGEKCNGYS